MRRVVCLAVAVALAAAGAARAEQKSDAKAVVEKAIKATGGEDNLAKLKSFTFKMKGKWYGMGDGIDYTGEAAVQLPDKSRVTIESDVGGNKFAFIQVSNGDKLWTKIGDDSKAVEDKDQIKEAKEDRYADQVASLLPLVKEKGFKLEPVGEVKVDGKPAVGVKVSHEGHRDINLFFDKESGLLVKSEHVIKDAMAGGAEQQQETIYSDFKEVGGVKHAMKVVINRDGKKYIDSEVSDLVPNAKLDEKTFEKP